jgi:FecR protein
MIQGGRLSKLLGMAVALGALIGLTVQAAPVQNKAVVRGVRGTASYSTDSGGNWKKLNVGTELRRGSSVRTAAGSTVDLFLGDNGPVVRVTENTQLGFDQLSVDDTGSEKVIETQLNLSNGRILGNVKKLAAASRYEVKTPNGVAGIRGTKYDISANGRVAVIEGTVTVVYIVNGVAIAPVQVNAGQLVIRQIEEELIPSVVDSQTPVVIVIPVNESPQGGDPAKNEQESPTGGGGTPGE